MEQAKGNTKEKRKFGGAAALAFLYGFLLMIYAPLETYFTNKNEFWFDFYGIIGAELLAAFLIFAGVFGGLFLAAKIHEKCYQALFLAGSILLLDFYIEGTYLVKNLPMLDGREVDWSKYISHRYISIAVFVVLCIVMGILVWKLTFPKLENYLKVAYLLLGAVLFVTLCSLAVMNNGLEKKERILINKTGEYDYSSTQNLIVFIVDSVDGDAFQKVMERHPEYRENLSDFTFYSNMLSTYTQTGYSVGYLLSGEWYEDQKEDFEDYLVRAYSVSPFLKRLQEENYRIGMYITEFVPKKCDLIYTFDNVKKSGTFGIDLINYWKVQTKMVIFRYAPFDVKRLVTVDTRDFMFSRKQEEKADLYYDLNEDFYGDLKAKEIHVTEDKFFKLYHIEGAHVPFRHDENVNVIENGSYDQSIEASLTIVQEWIEKLKAAGVYDNSALIIMADHGLSLKDIPEDRLHPAFFVKGINEHADSLRISEAPVSFEDMQTAFDRLMNGESGQQVFDWKEGDQRDRKCYFLSYPELMRNLECIQHGRAGDDDTLEILKNQ